ncbi:MAG: flagellar hook-associated protein FlgK [Oscillospiraceae bacterium]|nr:flagellar hook-associated protein FlgK [Oscillospiraceae bacterium]MCL2278250.1 flagellar hook-associated protein FlgK [Oscillospiraceae bacterium]
MIRSSFFGLEIGRSGLTTAQFGLEVTGHNIANVDTAGFTRQSVRQAAHAPFESVGRYAPVSSATVGGGTRVQILEQIRSSYLDRRFRSEMTTFSYWNTRSQSLSYVESFFDNANEATSINHAMAEFFRSMKITTNDPVAGAPRVLMRTTAEDLVQMLRMNHDGLVALQESENRAVITKTGEVNRRLESIRQLNMQIYNFEVTGLIANDLRDRRNLELDELSRLIDIDWEEREDQFGQSVFSLTIAGETAVHHDRRMTMSIGWLENPVQGVNTMVAVPLWAEFMPREFDPARSAPFPFDSGNDPSVPRFDMDMDAWRDDMRRYMDSVRAAAVDMRRISGGEIKAHMDVRDGIGDVPDTRSRGIPYYIEMINDLARALFVEINQQHAQGWTDNPLGSETGIRFFNAYDPEGNPIGRMIFVDEDGNEIAGADSSHPDVVGARFEVTADELAYITALNFFVSDDILASEYNIAASSSRIVRTGGDSTELQRGNNENMNAMYSIFGQTGITVTIGSGENARTREIGTFDDYGTIIRLDIANTLHTAHNNTTTSRLLTLAAGNQRAAIAGVSLDEEMVGLVRFQHAYNGAARVITAIDEALDRLINGTGRVGL